MDVMLVTIMLGSLASAIAFGTLLWQTKRQEQLRSDARVAALTSAIDGPRLAPPPERSTADAKAMFSPERHVAARGNPLIKAAVGIVMTLTVIVVVAMASHDAPASAPRTGSAASASADAAPALELTSMRHTRQGDSLVVTGLVRNRQRSQEVNGITAVVFAFGKDGAFIGSGRAPLDLSTLRPGDEASFVVNVPGGAEIQRYRVTFRTDRGVVRHLDRRAHTPAGPGAAPSGRS